jgi:hypothetical protein
MALLYLDEDELLTNENLQEVASLLCTHYDLLARFGRIFLPQNYKLEPWKDLRDNRVYCMLIKGDAMYKLTTMDDDQEFLRFDVIEAIKRHEEELERERRGLRGQDAARVEDDSQPQVPEGACEENRKRKAESDTEETFHCENVPQSRQRKSDDWDDLSFRPNGVNDEPLVVTSSIEDLKERHQAQSQPPRPPVTGSRSRPRGRRFSHAADFVRDLSIEELAEFLQRKDVDTAVYTRDDMIALIFKDYKLSESSPFEVLPTFLKSFKNARKSDDE